MFGLQGETHHERLRPPFERLVSTKRVHLSVVFDQSRRLELDEDAVCRQIDVVAAFLLGCVAQLEAVHLGPVEDRVRAQSRLEDAAELLVLIDRLVATLIWAREGLKWY